MKIKDKIYLNSSKEDNSIAFDELCEKYNIEPTEKALQNAMYACYEVCVNVEWDTDTGNCVVLGASE